MGISWETLKRSHPLRHLSLFSTLLLVTACGGSIDVKIEGSGIVIGYVKDKPVINCEKKCSYSNPESFDISFETIPMNDGDFIEWKGDGNIAGLCGQQEKCTLQVLPQDKHTITAVFTSNAKPNYSTCLAKLADSIKGLYLKTNQNEYQMAVRQFLCSTDWDNKKNAELKIDIISVFSAMFGDPGGISIDAKIDAWTNEQCTPDLGQIIVQENSLFLKYVSDLKTLQNYEACLAEEGDKVDFQCSIAKTPAADTFVYTIKPIGEGLTLTNFNLTSSNATKISATPFPDFLTAYDDINSGNFDLTFKISDIYQKTSVTVDAASKTFGNLSCTQEIPEAETPTYQLGGYISGLNGNIELDDGNGFRIKKSKFGEYRFATSYKKNDAYSVFIVQEPEDQSCRVANNIGVFTNKNIVNVNVVCASLAIKTTIPAPGKMTFIPRHVAGDREFKGHGPEVWVSVSLEIVNQGTQLQAIITMKAKETKSDWTEANETFKRIIYTTPAGKTISTIRSDSTDSLYYLDTDTDWDVFDLDSNGPVKRFSIIGDSRGDDAGIDTQVEITFNDIVVDIL